MSEGRKGRWTIASARQNLPALVDLAAREPQEIYRRDTLVARVVSPDRAGPVQPALPSATELLAELQRVCATEDYELPVAPRVDRPNAFAGAIAAAGTKGPAARSRRRPGKPRR